MAFIFVPNADGGFDEGDRQTNDETGVEYIYVDGAWRPLGPKIEDQFDELDNRYIKLSGTSAVSDFYRLRGPNAAGDGTSTFQRIDEGEQKLYNIKTPEPENEGWVANVEYVNNTVADYLPLTGGTINGELYLDVGANGVHDLGFAPRDVDNTSVIYSMNSGICRLRSLAGNNIQSIDVRTHFGWGRNSDGDPETVLYWLNDPTESHHAVNLQYLESYVADELEDIDLSEYLPLTGGSMTGGIDIDRESGAGLELKKAGTSNLKLWVDGGITTSKTTFNDDQLVTKTYVDDAIGDIDIPSPDLSSYLQKSGGTMTGDAYIRFSSGGLNFKKADGSTKSYFYNASDTTTQLTSYNGTKIVITARDGEPGSGRTFVDIQNSDSNGIGGTDSGYRMKLNHVADPTEDLHAANKRYVDTASGSKKYPGLRFKFSSGTGAVIGKFNYYDSGGLRLRVSNTSQDYKWNDGGLTVDYSFSEGHRFSIYEKLSDGTLKIIRTGTYNRADYHSGDVLFRVSSHQTNGSFNTSSEYYLTISGLF